MSIAWSRNAWLFSLTYASDVEILFTSVEYKPFKPLTLEASYFPVRTVRARATYVIFAPLRAFLGFDADHDNYHLADRGDKDDQLFYYEKRITGGMRFDLRHVGIELTGGYVFDRYYFEGEPYSERNENRFNVHDGTFVAGRLSFRW